jgi:uncharacterized protein YecE (DUF72 family)
MDIFIGTAGFSYKDWEGVVYPKDLKKRKIHPLEYLAQFIDCCEINTRFTLELVAGSSLKAVEIC